LVRKDIWIYKRVDRVSPLGKVGEVNKERKRGREGGKKRFRGGYSKRKRKRGNKSDRRRGQRSRGEKSSEWVEPVLPRTS
tara:strand:- start:824 stop:1063 length:240 start_codon:yes stop_codon:yes gene_type:complete